MRPGRPTGGRDLPRSMMRRRGLLLAGLAGLAGCGFELRRAPSCTSARIALTGFAPRSPLADELRMSIDASTTTHVVDQRRAGRRWCCEALDDAREKSRRRVDRGRPGARVRSCAQRFRFRLRTPAGKRADPARPRSLLARDMSYNESAALAKEQEEAALYRAMQSDIVAAGDAPAGGGAGALTRAAMQLRADQLASHLAQGLRAALHRARRRAAAGAGGRRRDPRRGARRRLQRAPGAHRQRRALRLERRCSARRRR